jgi:hypothetical protein
VTRSADKVTEPIEDTEDLNEAIGAARATAAGQADVGPSGGGWWAARTVGGTHGGP